VLATPYAFQENAADVSARTQRYFADSVASTIACGLARPSRDTRSRCTVTIVGLVSPDPIIARTRQRAEGAIPVTVTTRRKPLAPFSSSPFRTNHYVAIATAGSPCPSRCTE
jgi:hypothetical protein